MLSFRLSSVAYSVTSHSRCDRGERVVCASGNKVLYLGEETAKHAGQGLVT